MDASNIISHAALRTILFAIFFINGLIYIPKQSITSDEANHYNYAIRYVKGKPQKIKPYDDASAMPFSALNTIPRVIEQIFSRHLKKNDNGEEDITRGRYITLLVSLLIGWYLYRWSKAIYGEKAGLLSLFLFTFCPSISAHANLVTTDAYSALFTIAPLFHFWKYTKTRNQGDLIWFAVLLAMAQLSKQSLTYLYLLYTLLAVIAFSYKRTYAAIHVKGLIKKVLIVAMIQLVIINLGFQFNRTGQNLKNYEFKSTFFNNLKKRAHVVRSVPLPFPAPYLYGLDYTKKMDEWGGGAYQITPYSYLLGERRMKKGFSYYYLVVLFFKIPIAILIFITFSLILLIRRKPVALFFHTEIYLIVTVIFFLIYFDLFYNSQVGIRHIILILPLLYVLCGIAAKKFGENKAVRIFWYMNYLYCIISFYYYFPHLISYTNEFILNKKMAYKIMADSNLDYRQGEYYLNKFLAGNPAIQYAPQVPASGRFIISTNNLLDLDGKTNYQWLRDNFTPVKHLVFAYLIFEVSEKDLLKRGLR